MSKKITSPQKLMIQVELNSGKVLQFEKETKWTIDRVSSYYQGKYDNQWKSVDVRVVR